MIICPFCGEEILAVAKKCKHCREWLGRDRCDGLDAVPNPLHLQSMGNEIAVKSALSTSLAVLSVILVFAAVFIAWNLHSDIEKARSWKAPGIISFEQWREGGRTIASRGTGIGNEEWVRATKIRQRKWYYALGIMGVIFVMTAGFAAKLRSDVRRLREGK